MLSAASAGTRHLGFPCKSSRLPICCHYQVLSWKCKSLLKTLTSSSFNFFIAKRFQLTLWLWDDYFLMPFFLL